MIDSRSKLTLLQSIFFVPEPFRRTGGKAKGNGKPDCGFANMIDHVLSSALSDNSSSAEFGCSSRRRRQWWHHHLLRHPRWPSTGCSSFSASAVCSSVIADGIVSSSWHYRYHSLHCRHFHLRHDPRPLRQSCGVLIVKIIFRNSMIFHFHQREQPFPTGLAFRHLQVWHQ